ncbi:hypothetical protein C7N43_35390, partial [Sphingobacteriales bacterium UPWRP_1]
VSVSGTATPGSQFNVGTTSVVYTATDALGNTATCSFNITITDTQAPVISGCPSNFSICSPVGMWTPPTALDNCSLVSFTSNRNPGSIFPAGATTVVYTAADVSGNISTCSFVVTYSPVYVTAIKSNYNGYNISCNGGNNGSITVLASGGTAPYTFVWSNGATGSVLTGLTAGTYSVTATDVNGCTKVRNITLTQPPVMNCTATVSNVTCNGNNDGSISATTTGGVAPYTYLWNTGASTPSISGLAPGTYSLTVTDKNGCVCVQSLTVSEPSVVAPLEGSVNVYEGGGITSSYFNLNTITFTGGTPPYSYDWSTSGYVQYSVVAPGQINVVYSDGSLWSVTITDSNGCGGSDLIFDNYPDGTEPTAQLDIVYYEIVADDGLTGGSITLTVEGGNPCAGGAYHYEWDGPGVWSPAGNTNTGTLTGLPSGWYIVTVTDCGPDGIYNNADDHETTGWYWVPAQLRGRSKTELPGFASDALQVYPNPFAQSATVMFTVPETMQVQLTLFDLTGREVVKIFDGIAGKETVQEVSIDGSNIPQGVYLCRMFAPELGIQTQQRVMIVR